MKLVIGLGNPGMAYSNSRHNVGFMCLRYFAKQHKISFDKRQGRARVGLGEVAGQSIVLARPQTFMNASGEAVNYLVNRYQIDLDDLVVIHDDLDLPLGKIRIRQGGRSAGHKGIESIIHSLGSTGFIRVRIGIGRPEETTKKEVQVIDFVLNGFTKTETKVISPVIFCVGEALLSLLIDGLEAAMNKFNRSQSEKTAP